MAAGVGAAAAGWRATLDQAWRRHRDSVFSSLLITLAGLGVYVHTYLFEARTAVAGLVNTLELKTYDQRFRWRGAAAAAPDIVIVAIDQATLERLGSWPFSRRHHARLIERLAADGAAVVAFDINFPKPEEKSGIELVRRARQDYLEQTPAARRDPRYLARLAALEQQADTDAEFAEAIRRAGNVVLGYFFFTNYEEVRFVDEAAQEVADSYLTFSSYSTRPVAGERAPRLEALFAGEEGYLAATNLPAFTEAAEFRVGYFNFTADADGVFRRAPLVFRYGAGWRREKKEEAQFYPSLTVQVLRQVLGVPEHEMVLVYNEAGVEAIQLGARRLPTDAAGRLLIHFQGGPFTYPHFSFADVTAGTFPPGSFRDKVVFVGPTAAAIGDFAPTPFAESYHAGVEIHTNLLDTMLNQRFLHRGAREELLDLGFILFFGLGLGVGLALVRPAWTTPLAATTLAAFLAIAYGALVWLDSWLNLVVPAGVLLANFAVVAAVRVLFEERAKRQVRAAFAQYVPPELVSELMKHPERLRLGGEERELTILFSDIRGFTTLAEKLSPTELTDFINAYTDEMTDILFRHWGTLDKFEGDAILAFWGAPQPQDDHALRACAGALEMSRRVDELRGAWRAEGKPELNVGLGLSTGRVVVGNMGSRRRFNYTVLGDTVNLASRLEGVTKEYSARIVVSESTRRQAAEPLALLEQRLCREFNLEAADLVAPNASEPARRARAAGLHLARRRELAPLPALAQRFGFGGELEAERALAEVEQWQARDATLRRFLAGAESSLRRFLFRPLDWIRVKGKREPVAIYELLGETEADSRLAELVTLFETGLEAYRGQQWDAAEQIFNGILEQFPDDGPARLFVGRCRHYRAQPPPPDWDGVHVMTTK
ncbi:MAG: CHASE2 domain-containing protein [Acidobacteria bacterium]|nr:CHASE2 domain-containing protein [Acidobacteriota bacterium]